MKKLMSVIAVLFSLSAYSWFPIQASCFVNGGANAYCQACNYQGVPLYCQMNINGQTSFGYFINGWAQGQVFPGLCLNGNVFAHNPYTDPLVFANAQVLCRY